MNSASTAPLPVLVATSIHAGYGAMPAISDISLHVRPGEMVALLGANGAGKSTTLLSLVGGCTLFDGQIRWKDKVINRWPSHKRAADGIGFVSEEKSVFMGLSALDNLRLGQGDVDVALDLFPELRPLLKRRAGLLSGGEQQMLTLARALAARPEVLLVDELSLGLAPKVVQRLLAALRQAASDGVGILMVEQQATTALAVTDRAYVLKRGNLVLEGDSGDLRGRSEELERVYLSGS